MRRFFIKFSYIGTQYRGAEKSTNNSMIRDADSIQGALQSAFSQIIPRPQHTPRIVLSSRTDAGVHALCSSGHVDILPKNDTVFYDASMLIQNVNRFLVTARHQIRLLDAVPVTLDFHARHLAKSRTYLYKFMVPKDIGNHKAPIIDLQYCFHIRPKTFDVERVQKATELFIGLKDFRTFTPKQDNPKIYVRRLNVLKLQKGSTLFAYDPHAQNFDYWDMICQAPGFLHNQVRRIATTLLYLGMGRLSEKDIQVMLQVPNYKNWVDRASVVPPHGLHLLNVEYDEEEVKQYVISNPQSKATELLQDSAKTQSLKSCVTSR